MISFPKTYRWLPGALAVGAVVAVLSSAPAQAQDNGWTTPLATKLGVTLLEDFDSSGPDAWDPNEHPIVFITTEGPGYGGLLGRVSQPGVAIIDADTHEVVASMLVDVESLGWCSVFQPHGLGVSPDGQWIYLPSGDGGSKGRLRIINARTLKFGKVLGLMGRPRRPKFRARVGSAQSANYTLLTA